MVVISKKLKSCYISCLPARVQAEMKREIVEALRNEKNIQELTAEAMASRVNDIENLIDIEYF